MRKADANRVTRAADKVQEAYELLSNANVFNRIKKSERKDYRYFHRQLYWLSMEIGEWKKQVQENTETD